MTEGSSQRPVFLLGFMGAGKTTLGKRLAYRLGLPFTDLDDLLTEQYGQSIPEMFATVGEAVFRKRERAALQQLAAQAGIVSLGGGTPCYADNMDWLLKHGYTIYLRVPVGMLIARLAVVRAGRPLLSQVPEDQLPAFIGQLLAAREPYYCRAHAIVEQPDVKKLSDLLSFAAQEGAPGL